MKKIFLLAICALGMSATAQKLSNELTAALKNDDTRVIATLVTTANKDTCYEFNSGTLNVLQLATSMGSGDVVHHLLVELKLDPNTTCSGRTALQFAASQGRASLVKDLLDAGANVNTVFEGKTALDYAKESKNAATIALLSK